MIHFPKYGRLGKRHDRFEREWVAVSLVPIGQSTNGVTENLDRRFRHVLVVVIRTCLAKIFSAPEPVVTGCYILFLLDAR